MFKIANLATLAYAQGFTLWLYRHDGPIMDIYGKEFFHDARNMFLNGDHMHVRATNGNMLIAIEKHEDNVIAHTMGVAHNYFGG